MPGMPKLDSEVKPIVQVKRSYLSSSSLGRFWAIAATIFCVCSLGVIVWRTTNKSTIVLKIETIPAQSSLLELQRVIEAQKKTIDLYAKRPKVIFRCLDDEPKLKYPRRASNDYTSVIMGTNDECGNTFELDAVVMVHSAARNFFHRERFRRLYGNWTATRPYKLKVVFLIGQVEDASLQTNLELENRHFGDTIQGNFMDTYQNLTLKAVMGYRWLTETCKDLKLLLKMDDDVAFDVHAFFGDYWHPLRKDKKVQRIFCQVWRHAAVNRKGKWKVEKGLFRNATYDFPYCSGFFVAVTADLIKPMYQAARMFDFFWIDDVFMYGMVPNTIKTLGHTQLGAKVSKITQSKRLYQECLKAKGTECPYFAIVAQSGDDLLQTVQNFTHQQMLRRISKIPENIKLKNDAVVKKVKGN